MSVVTQIYNQKCATSSDINEHLPVLLEYAKKCKIIAEYGVREVVSTYAFAVARPEKLIFLDINRHPNVDVFLQQCKEENINAEFYQADTHTFELEQSVDLLFIDTLHTYPQLVKELDRHHSKVNKYIILHDTVSFGFINEFNVQSEPKGLMPAVKSFLDKNSNWIHVHTYTNNNGLTVLSKT